MQLINLKVFEKISNNETNIYILFILLIDYSKLKIKAYKGD